MIKNGGYTMLDLATATYKDVAAAFNANKPILVYDNSQVYYADTCVYDSDNDAYVITKGGKTITIDSSNNVVSSGDILTIMENIVDSQGNKRFVEGVGELGPNVASGVNITYNKWSLSGSHLMFVLAGAVEANTVLGSPNQIIVTYAIPDWIFSKIYPIASASIEIKEIGMFKSEYTFDSLKFLLSKGSTKVSLSQLDSYTPTVDVSFRIQFDLVIDNE